MLNRKVYLQKASAQQPTKPAALFYLRVTFKTNTPLISTSQSADANINSVRARPKSPAVRRRALQRGRQKKLMVRAALVSDPRSRVEKDAPGWAVNTEWLLEHYDYQSCFDSIIPQFRDF